MRWLVVALLARHECVPCPMPSSGTAKRRTRLAPWLVAVAVGALLPGFASEAAERREDTKLLPADGVPQAQFGWSAAIDGDTAVIGAQQDNDGGGFSGAAYVFRDAGAIWDEEQKLVASDAAPSRFFGASVGVAGDTIVVGAYRDSRLDDAGTPSIPGDDVFLENAGAAYVFRHNGTAWVEEQKLVASDAAAFDWFGFAVAIFGDTIVVGAYLDDTLDDSGTPGVPGDDRFLEDSGSAYVFRYNGTTWVQEQKLLVDTCDLSAPPLICDPTDPEESVREAGDFFGVSVAISGDTIVVGADGEDSLALRLNDRFVSDHGAAYVFRYNGTTWLEEAKLVDPDILTPVTVTRQLATNDRLGHSVAIDGDTTVIGAYRDAVNGNLAGSARAYRFDGTAWVTDSGALLTASDAGNGDQLGISVSFDNDYAVIGAYANDANGAASGSAYVFEYDGTSWVEELKLVASDGQAYDSLGGYGPAVGVAGFTAVVGAFAHGDNGPDAGSAYVFTVPEPSALALQLSALAALGGLARRARRRTVAR